MLTTPTPIPNLQYEVDYQAYQNYGGEKPTDNCAGACGEADEDDYAAAQYAQLQEYMKGGCSR